jgi:hypothetical protein
MKEKKEAEYLYDTQNKAVEYVPKNEKKGRLYRY